MTIIYKAEWVLPVTAPPIHSGAVAVDDQGIITYVGSRDDAPAGELRDFGKSILMPGLINAHTHLELTVLRNTLEGLSFPDWIDKLRAMRNIRVLDDTALLNSARNGIAEGVRAGITTYADTSFSGDLVLQAMLEAGVRGIVYQETFGPAPEQCELAATDLKSKVRNLREKVTAGNHDLITIGVSPHAPYTVCDDLYRETVNFAQAENLPIAIHIAESQEEDDLVRRGAGPFAERLKARNIAIAPRAPSPMALMKDLGVLSDRTLLIHCVRADEDDIGLARDHACSFVHCPASNAKLGHGIAPLAAFLKAGIPTGLGSDSMASNNYMNILAEARLAVLFQNAKLADPKAITLQTAIELATIGGAKALGLHDKTGSLEAGKEADLAAFSLSPLQGESVSDPVAAAIFSLSSVTTLPAVFVAVKGAQVFPK